MHLSKEQIVKLVVDAIGPDLCPINELFKKLSNSVEGTFMTFGQFCGFINKRSTLFDLFFIDGTILVQKKVEVKDDSSRSSSPSPSTSNGSNVPMPFKRPHLADMVKMEDIIWVKTMKLRIQKEISSKQLETHVLDAIGPRPCQITDLLETLRVRFKGAYGPYGGNIEEFHRYIERRSHLFELSMDEGGLIFVKKKTNDKDDESSVQSDTSGSLGNVYNQFY